MKGTWDTQQLPGGSDGQLLPPSCCTSLQLHRSFSHAYKFPAFEKNKFNAREANEKKQHLQSPLHIFHYLVFSVPSLVPLHPSQLSFLPPGFKHPQVPRAFFTQHQNHSTSSALMNAVRTWPCLQVGRKIFPRAVNSCTAAAICGAGSCQPLLTEELSSLLSSACWVIKTDTGTHLEDQTVPQRAKSSQLFWPFLKHPKDVSTLRHHHEAEESLSHSAFSSSSTTTISLTFY